MADRVQLLRGTDSPMPPSSWSPLAKGWAVVRCANGHVATVRPPDHEIAEDGTISPSLVCPAEPCGWHVFAQLVGWEDRAK